MMRQYWKVHDLVSLGTVPLFGAIVFSALPLLALVFNGAVARTLLFPIALLCLGFYLHGTLVVPYSFSLAAGKPEISVKMNVWALFVTVPATVALVYSFGLVGASVSWVFYHLFAYAYGVPRICSECLRIPALEWYKHMGRIAALTGLTYGLAWTLLGLPGTGSVLTLTVGYASATLAFLLGASWLMRAELRATVARSLRVGRMKTAEFV